ncbi:hypothetical protein [Labrys monachus]|uniref:YD repeat-containing protein n=1 Tax=Labrys monachus TaxID=217067 RepID=A0ABU0FEU0_9HYPH|nr:hypothetical protein [Labrys monachus]MDQ0393125.1 YD repeat-containing protein [Labrys monachus]
MVDGPPSYPFRVDILLAGSIRAFLRDAGPILAVNAVPSLPALAILAATGRPSAAAPLLDLVPTLLCPILSLLAAGLTADGAYRRLHGGRFFTGAGVRRAVRRFLPLLGASILSWLLIMVGLAAFVVPGLMAVCALYVVLPVCVIEERGSVDSMERAAALTRGRRWTIFALFAISTLPMLAASAVLGDFSPRVPMSAFQAIGDEAVSLVYLAFSGVTLAVSYDALRRLHEEADSDGDVASVA